MKRKQNLSPRTRIMLTRRLIKAGSADTSLRWIVTGIVLATIMFILALLIPNLGETHDEWVEYNRLSSHHSPSNGAASPPSPREGRPYNFPALDGASELRLAGRRFWPHETGRGESRIPLGWGVAGFQDQPSTAATPSAWGRARTSYAPAVIQPYHTNSGVSAPTIVATSKHLSSFALSVAPSVESAPESQIITPAISRSPVMDRLMPQKAQNRSLSSVGDVQIENARQVERILWSKGYRQPKAIVAILANGWHESRWNAGTVYKEKNGTYSRGFFQLTNGALTIEGNVEQLTTRAPYAARIKKWYADFKAHNWSAGEAAYWFARRVEICASRFWNERKQTAERWWLLMEEHK